MKNLIFIFMLLSTMSNAQITLLDTHITEAKSMIKKTGYSLDNTTIKNQYVCHSEGSTMMIEVNENQKVIMILIYFHDDLTHVNYIKYLIDLLDTIDSFKDVNFKNIGYDSFIASYCSKKYIIRDNDDKRTITFKSIY